MRDTEHCPVSATPERTTTARQPLVVRVADTDFYREVLEKLARLEAKMDMLVGSAQPGRMKLAEDRLCALERSDIRRSVYDRLLSAAVAAFVSAAMHDHLLGNR
jgi:cytochrome c-type biogenesis protein CcmH/NrfG